MRTIKDYKKGLIDYLNKVALCENKTLLYGNKVALHENKMLLREHKVALYYDRINDEYDEAAFCLIMEAYRLQKAYNPVYSKWCSFFETKDAKNINKIPFLPIKFYKTLNISSLGDNDIEDYFLSSGTSSIQRSRLNVYDKEFYLKNCESCFSQFFGKVEKYCFICLLPNYIEQGHSSLVAMMDSFVKKSRYKESGFYTENLDKVALLLRKNEQDNIPTILFGVTYALLDLIEKENFHLHNTLVFETGGMKGRRKEISKEELHDKLRKGFGVERIYSEYGMCELFSQGYCLNDTKFHLPKQMYIIIKEINNPKSEPIYNKCGIINIIDLANIDTCCFIETEDLGIMHEDYTFEIVGRSSNADLRGCNLMYNEI